jgi:hypothetical protein
VDTAPGIVQSFQLRELYGRVRSESRGWNDAVNLICTCGSGDDHHRADCPLWEDAIE